MHFPLDPTNNPFDQIFDPQKLKKITLLFFPEGVDVYRKFNENLMTDQD